jgi:para-aminobenzoate synthetase component I
VQVRPRISREHYLAQVEKIKKHIKLGDVYEMNFCQEFYAENAAIDPGDVYRELNAISATPFSAFCRLNDHYLLCASPERFLSKSGSRLVSQPIKGTARRGITPAEDEQLKKALAASEKERSENVMIVDLVRNDLSRIAKRGSVKVDELFGIHTFEQVHQMISTVSAEVKEDISFIDIIRATFPMGSMTGAPKVRAMQLIEEYESSKRGLYSGAVGYIDPSGDFDLNVVIRSILYNSASRYLSFTVGGAITDRSDAGQEYEECMIKAAAMLRVLKSEVPAR